MQNMHVSADSLDDVNLINSLLAVYKLFQMLDVFSLFSVAWALDTKLVALIRNTGDPLCLRPMNSSCFFFADYQAI